MSRLNLPLADFHVHTTYSDGAHSPTEVAREAFERGLVALGFSTHSYTYFDESYCIKRERMEEYKREIASLKHEYAGRMHIFAGVEQDYYSDVSPEGFDYVIGSVHYLKAKGEYFAIDHRCHLLLDAVERGYDGDLFAMLRAYFEAIGDVAHKQHADLVGHFDVICKFNEKDPFFDERDPRYIALWQGALDKLLCASIPFEVNTGAISRGHKTVPYPSDAMLRYIKAHGGEVLLSGDSHAKQNLCYAFDTTALRLNDLGFDLAATQNKWITALLRQGER